MDSFLIGYVIGAAATLTLICLCATVICLWQSARENDPAH